jgi:hypothetical protein
MDFGVSTNAYKYAEKFAKLQKAKEAKAKALRDKIPQDIGIKITGKSFRVKPGKNSKVTATDNHSTTSATPKRAAVPQPRIRCTYIPIITTDLKKQAKTNAWERDESGNFTCDSTAQSPSYLPPKATEAETVLFLQGISIALTEQGKLMEDIQDSMDATRELAKARFGSGSEMGAILSLRKVYKWKRMHQHATAERDKTIELFLDVEADLEQARLNPTGGAVEVEIDLEDQRKALKHITESGGSLVGEVPSDEFLGNELRDMVSTN